MCSSDLTQDHIAAFLATQGIHIYAWNGQTNKEYDWCLDQVLSHKPSLICDDGADMNVKVHFDKKFKSLKILGSTEETTAGVTRVQAMEKQGKLKYPVVIVNDADTKHMFDNRYGTGQSTIDGYLRAMGLLFTSKKIVVVGYGWVGRGVAERSRGMVDVNGAGIAVDAPFGGYKHSGIGREAGKEGLIEFLEVKSVGGWS